MTRRNSHAPTQYLVRRDNLPTINFTVRDNQRAAPGYYLDPQDPETWRPVDLTGKNLTGWFKPMCKNGDGAILFGIPVLRHAPFEEGKCTMLGSPSVLMDVAPGWYEVEIEAHTCATSYKQTIWKRFKFCIREDFDTTETDGMNAPIYRDSDGVLQELPISPPVCNVPYEQTLSTVVLDYYESSYTYTGRADDVDGVVSQVQYRLNGGNWMGATNTGHQYSTFEFTVTGIPLGQSQVEVRAVDESGYCSVLQDCLITRASNTPPTVNIDCGDLVPDEEPNACFDGIRRSDSTYAASEAEGVDYPGQTKAQAAYYRPRLRGTTRVRR